MLIRRHFLPALWLALTTLASSQTFTSTTYNVGPNPQKLIRVDVNSDGAPDLITGNSDGTVTVMVNNGNGTFRRLDAIAGQSGTTITDVFAADLNNDAKPDLVVVDALPNGTANLNVLLGRGDGTFNAPSTIANHVGGAAAVAAQFSSEGNRDIAFGWNSVDPNNSTQRHANVTIYFGDGTGAFPTHTDMLNIGAQDDYANGGAGYQISQMNTGDFNGDGRTDFIIGECCAGVDVELGAAYAYLNNGNGTFSPRQLFTAIPNEVRVGDIDGNGRSDVLIPYSGCHTPCFGLTAYTNVAGSSSGVDLPTPIPGGGIDDFYASATVGDFTLSGARTIAYSVTGTSSSGSQLSVVGFAQKNSSGGYSVLGTYNTGNNVLRSLADGDFNRDGKPELAGIPRPNDGTTLSQIVVLTNTTPAPACSASSNRSVKICSPTSGSTVATPVRVLAGLRSDAGIKAAQIYLDSSLVYQAPAGTKVLDRFLSVGSGSHKITVKGWDAAGAFSSSATISVSGGTSTCTASANRTVNICLPANGSTVSSPVRVLAGLRSDTGIQATQIYLDGQLVFQGPAGTKTVDRSMSIAAGGHRITVKGWDKAGAFSSSVGITAK